MPLIGRAPQEVTLLAPRRTIPGSPGCCGANSLKGEMSWIGPRPEALKLAEGHESSIPFHSYRHIVRPGIFGWATVDQGNVAGFEAATTKLHYHYYIKYFSHWLALLFLARTVLIGVGRGRLDQ